MSRSSSCLSLDTSSTTSPRSTVELFQHPASMVEDTTYLGMLFSLSAHSPLRDAHRDANHSSVRRPNSSASVASASLVKMLDHSSRSFPPYRPNQPPCVKPSCPSGSWTTPSSDVFVLITIFPISFSFIWR